jgi:hypothetical protein
LVATALAETITLATSRDPHAFQSQLPAKVAALAPDPPGDGPEINPGAASAAATIGEHADAIVDQVADGGDRDGLQARLHGLQFSLAGLRSQCDRFVWRSRRAARRRRRHYPALPRAG